MQIEPIGIIDTPYDEKFAVPRQPRLVESPAIIRFFGDYNQMACFRGIEQFSHLWLIFHFHQTEHRNWKPLVRPPRLGGNKKLGVFSTRSSHRPNSLGLSAVRLLELKSSQGTPQLLVTGPDLVSGTPIMDIKPYIPYTDTIDDANGGFATQAPDTKLDVIFSDQAAQQLAAYPNDFQQLIRDVLAQDPRPAYQKQPQMTRTYGCSLKGVNVRWQVTDQQILVLDLQS